MINATNITTTGMDVLNCTVSGTAHAITYSGYSWFVILLAVFGLIFLANTLINTGWNLVYVGAYIYGFFKWMINKIRKREN